MASRRGELSLEQLLVWDPSNRGELSLEQLLLQRSEAAIAGVPKEDRAYDADGHVYPISYRDDGTKCTVVDGGLTLPVLRHGQQLRVMYPATLIASIVCAEISDEDFLAYCSDVQRNVNYNHINDPTGMLKHMLSMAADTSYKRLASDSKLKCAATGCSNEKAQNGDGLLKKCGRCHVVFYCSRGCQLAHWKDHKVACKKSPIAKSS